MDIIGTDLQILKAALPSPSIHSSIKEYYGLRSRVARFLTLKVFMTPASPIRVGWAFPISNALLEATKLNIRDVSLNPDYPSDLQNSENSHLP